MSYNVFHPSIDIYISVKQVRQNYPWYLNYASEWGFREKRLYLQTMISDLVQRMETGTIWELFLSFRRH